MLVDGPPMLSDNDAYSLSADVAPFAPNQLFRQAWPTKKRFRMGMSSGRIVATMAAQSVNLSLIHI